MIVKAPLQEEGLLAVLARKVWRTVTLLNVMNLQSVYAFEVAFAGSAMRSQETGVVVTDSMVTQLTFTSKGLFA